MKNTFTILNQIRAAEIIGDYAIGGAVGATFYLEPVATLDVDVFVIFSGSETHPLLSLTPIYLQLFAATRL